MTEAGPAAAGDPARVRVIREQALSHADLHRLLPRILAPAECRAGPQSIVARFPDGRALEMALEPEVERRIGGLRLRSTRFSFVFEGWHEREIEDFLRHCERSLQQGGG